MMLPATLRADATRRASLPVWYLDRFEVLRHAAAVAPTTGLVLEFGVAMGTTIRCLSGSAPLLDRLIYGFDSFKGLPEPWANYPKGYFACDIPEVPNNVELVIGEFENTLVPFLDKHQDEDIALVHIDCDLYSSTRFVLDHLTLWIRPGTVIVLDEFWIVTDQEQRAFNDWLEDNNRSCWHEARSIEQLCVVMQD
jgi:Macrocin-O-methyltransferase (TylF)